MLAAAEDAMEIAAAGRMPNALFFIGARGVGKTVLLAEIARRAAVQRGWPQLSIELTSQAQLVPQLLARADILRELVREAKPKAKGLEVSEATVRASLPGVSGEVRLEPPGGSGVGPLLALEAALGRLAEAAVDKHAGVVVRIDEAQLVERPDLETLGAALQVGVEAGWPYVVVLAGLDTVRTLVSDRPGTHSSSYLERADWYELGLLDEADTLRALCVPAGTAGRPLEPAAAQFLAAQTGGFPYAVQVYGYHAWEASNGRDRIDLEAAERGSLAAAGKLEVGLYGSRWAQASPREQEYLAAVAALTTYEEGFPSGGAVAARLGTTASELSSYRARLLDKGILMLERGGGLRFAMPGMAKYVLDRWDREHSDELPGKQAAPDRRASVPQRGHSSPRQARRGPRRRSPPQRGPDR
jgi:hypothetical protein